jgi:hypothetical protein
MKLNPVLIANALWQENEKGKALRELNGYFRDKYETIAFVNGENFFGEWNEKEFLFFLNSMVFSNDCVRLPLGVVFKDIFTLFPNQLMIQSVLGLDWMEFFELDTAETEEVVFEKQQLTLIVATLAECVKTGVLTGQTPAHIYDLRVALSIEDIEERDEMDLGETLKLNLLDAMENALAVEPDTNWVQRATEGPLWLVSDFLTSNFLFEQAPMKNKRLAIINAQLPELKNAIQLAISNLISSEITDADLQLLIQYSAGFTTELTPREWLKRLQDGIIANSYLKLGIIDN